MHYTIILSHYYGNALNVIMDFTLELTKLRVLYPSADVSSLQEILESCDGSVLKVRDLLGPSEEIIRNQIINEENQVGPPQVKTDNNITITRPPIGHTVKNSLVASSREEQNIIKKHKIDIKDILTGKRTKVDEERHITLTTVEEIEHNIPYIKVFKNFLPKDLSKEMIDSLMSKRLMFQEKEFYIAGQLCRSSQNSVTFTTPKFNKLKNNYSSNEIRNVDFFHELYVAKAYVDQRVNEILNSRVKDPLQIQTDWKSDVCVGNHFMNNKSHLDWHSDRLSMIGPLPTIASLSFGATRIFRLRRTDTCNSTIFNIPLPNNTLLIMLPGTQELYKHSVPSLTTSLVASHPKTKDSRFSLTFRMIHPKLDNNPTVCDKCKERMILRRSSKNGQYIWMCFSSYKGGQCNRILHADFTNLNDLETNSVNFTSKDNEMGSSWHEKRNK